MAKKKKAQVLETKGVNDLQRTLDGKGIFQGDPVIEP